MVNLDDWFEIFNIGVGGNEFKWEHVYWTQTPNYVQSDAMADLFESKNVPLRGHVVFWSVDGHSPAWYEVKYFNLQSVFN